MTIEWQTLASFFPAALEILLRSQQGSDKNSERFVLNFKIFSVKSQVPTLNKRNEKLSIMINASECVSLGIGFGVLRAERLSTMGAKAGNTHELSGSLGPSPFPCFLCHQIDSCDESPQCQLLANLL